MFDILVFVSNASHIDLTSFKSFGHLMTSFNFVNNQATTLLITRKVEDIEISNRVAIGINVSVLEMKDKNM